MSLAHVLIQPTLAHALITDLADDHWPVGWFLDSRSSARGSGRFRGALGIWTFTCTSGWTLAYPMRVVVMEVQLPLAHALAASRTDD